MPPENQPPTKDEVTPSSPLKQIRTFQGDVAEALHTQNESLQSIRETEQKKTGGYTNTQPESPRDNKYLLLLLGSVVLLALTGAGGYYTYLEVVKKTSPPTIIAPESRFISPESSVAINLSTLDRETLFQTLSQESAGNKPGELKHFVLRNSASSTAPLSNISSFLEKLGSQAPGNLVRSIEPVFMLGSLGNSRFIILKLNSFENAFAGMLAWEKNMAEDIGGLFATAPLMQGITQDPVYTDEIYKNKDARALILEVETLLLYSFFNNQILIITDEPETLQTLIDRLTREGLER